MDSLYGCFMNIFYREHPQTKGMISVYSIKGWEGEAVVSEEVLGGVGS